jgi:D-glycero-alpha-D-manno-heptose-7-phosphate kinase
VIVTRTPFRVSFLGGGTDIPWFYEANGGGAVLSAAIDKHMYLSAHPLFDSQDILLKYSKIERVRDALSLEHPIARTVLSDLALTGLDISVSSDVPAGTGLGSSSAFTVGLIHLLSEYSGNPRSTAELARKACEVEIDLLNEPIGKQDQYASAFGGLNLYNFLGTGEVKVSPIKLQAGALEWLSKSLLLVQIGRETRSASKILQHQRSYSQGDNSAIQDLIDLRELTLQTAEIMEHDITSLGKALQAGWELKKGSHPGANLEQVDNLIDSGMSAGALGAKLLGAGGGGFVLFLVEDSVKDRLIEAVKPLATMSVGVDSLGSSVIYSN